MVDTELATIDGRVAAALLDVTGPLRRALRRSMRRELPGNALPQAQVELLAFVDRQPSVRVHEAAGALQLAPNTVSTLVNQLSRLGLLRRRRDVEDGRSVCLSITQEAGRVLAARRAFRRHAVAVAMSTLSTDDRCRIEDALPALRRLVAQLEEAA
jgi:DNA-binding MarR family transcriptional regulator